MSKFVINATVIGRIVESEIGLAQLVRQFNRYRKDAGLKPVLRQTVHRYNSGGIGYEKTPTAYRKFLAQYVALI